MTDDRPRQDMPATVFRDFAELPDIERPEGCCPMCERPGGDGTICEGCIAVQETRPGDPGFIKMWLGMEPRERRRLLALHWGRDPWTGREYPRAVQRTEFSERGKSLAYEPLQAAAVPRTSWDLG